MCGCTLIVEPTLKEYVMFIREQTIEWCNAPFTEAAHEDRLRLIPQLYGAIDVAVDWFAMWRGV